MSSHRTFPALIALLSGACALGTGYMMATRVGSFNKTSTRAVYAFDNRLDTSFTFAERPVTLTTDRSDPNNIMLIVKYGEDQLRLRATIPGNEHLPGLTQHEDWMRLTRFGIMSGRTMEKFKADLGVAADLPERLAIITKTPRPGSDPQSWGQVWIKDWSFEFHEFLPQGGFKTERFHYPTHRRGEKPKAGDLIDNSWQFQAALMLMPQQARERLMGRYENDAMHALGWMLPFAAFAGAICVFAIGFAAAPARVRRLQAAV